MDGRANTLCAKRIQEKRHKSLTPFEGLRFATNGNSAIAKLGDLFGFGNPGKKIALLIDTYLGVVKMPAPGKICGKSALIKEMP